MGRDAFLVSGTHAELRHRSDHWGLPGDHGRGARRGPHLGPASTIGSIAGQYHGKYRRKGGSVKISATCLAWVGQLGRCAGQVANENAS